MILIYIRSKLNTLLLLFNSLQGAPAKLAESPVPERHCGTVAPGWLQGTHPTEVQQVKLTDSPVLESHCGAVAPGWLQGTHTTKVQQVKLTDSPVTISYKSTTGKTRRES